MEMACFNLSIVNNNSQTEGHSDDDAFDASYSLMNEIIDNFSCKAENRRLHQHTYVLSNKEQSSSDSIVASSSNPVSEISSVNRSGGKLCKDKALMYGSEVDRLNDRLRTLEEETEIMKQAFIESMDERKKLMNEICQQFRVIRIVLRPRKQVTGDESTHGVLVVNPHQNRGGGKGTGLGLSQVLHQQSNPSIVIRDLRATMEAFEEPADTYDFSNR
ncbi:hypothetical protein ACSBR2_023544 [Camellia fascicularis]